MDLRNTPQEHRPPWAMLRPEQPYLAEVRRGIRYVGLEPPTLRALLEVPGVAVLAAFGAMGPDLFWEREDGPWIPYDLDARDQNQDCLIRERPWPWCWGDHVWSVASWDTQPVILSWTPHGCSLVVERPPPDPDMMRELARIAYDEATRIAGGAAVGTIPRAEFLGLPHDDEDRERV